MAGRKGNVSNDAFLKNMQANTQKATREVSETLKNVSVRSAVGNGRKMLEYRDIYELKPAPTNWNRYPLLKDDQPERYLELKMSIYERGVENPLVLWKRNGECIILAGHNRCNICREIVEECREENGFDEQKYRFLPCIVYENDEITEEQAREIINDTNLYRDFSKLPNKIKIQITMERMEFYKRRRYAKGERIDQLAKDLGLEKTAVYENLSIYEKVIPALQEMYYNEQLTRKAVLKFVFFDKDIQQWIFDTYGDKINDTRAKALKKNMSKIDIAHIFEMEGKGVKKVTVDVPEARVEEFRKVFAKWLKGELKVADLQDEARADERISAGQNSVE